MNWECQEIILTVFVKASLECLKKVYCKKRQMRVQLKIFQQQEEGKMSKIQIQTKQVKFPVAEDLYGLFFEDINRSGDGGLYPEMLRNRAFEDSIIPERCTPIDGCYGFETPTGWRDQFNNGEGLKRWLDGIKPTPVPAWYGEAANLILMREGTLNKNREAALKIEFSEGGSVYNVGYRGIAVEAGQEYPFYMFAKADRDMELVLTIERENGGAALAETKIQLPKTEEFRRFDAVLRSKGAVSDCIFRIRSASEGAVILGFTSLMPADTYKGHGMRKDLMEMLEGTHSKFLRFPGGCIVEGFTKETMMRFPNTIGPVWERPGQQLMWHYRATNGLGFHEYLQICEDLHLEPMYVINCGLTCQGRYAELTEGEELEILLQEAFDAIEYATAPADTKWGTMRAEAGHPEPFGMKYIEIGNENIGQEYCERYEKFYKELKKRYPELIYISNIHTEKEGHPTEVVDEHYYSTPEFFQENQNMFADYDRKGPKIFVGEYAVTSGNDIGNLYSALAETMYLLGIENNQDVVTLTSYAPLLQNVDYTGWYPDLIAFNNHQTFAIPLYYAIQMLAANRGEEIYETQLEGTSMYTKNVGIPGFIAYEDGVTLRNVICNGKKAGVTHTLVGNASEENGEISLKIGPSMELDNFPGIGDTKKEICYVAFGDECSGKNVFEADVKIDSPEIPIAVTLWNSHCPMLFALDETDQRSDDWSPIFTEHHSWMIEEGKGTACMVHWFQDQPIGESVKLPMRYGEYMHLKVETREDGFDCFIDGKKVQEVYLSSHPSTAVSVSGDRDTIQVKIVNMNGERDDVEIILDCEVEDAYTALVLTADSPKAENDFGNPRRVAPEEKICTGAGSRFVYEAPGSSFSVLKLKKR